MIALYNDPEGKNVFKRMRVKTTVTQMSSTGISSNTNTNSAAPTSNKDGDIELSTLRERVTHLEERLKLYEEKKEAVL